MAGIKIVDLPALGRDLISTDLLEVSLNGSGSRKITGQEIMNASKLAVGSTPIVSGTVGRLLFQNTGDVLGQSGSLFWDNTNGRLGIGTSSPATGLDARSGFNLWVGGGHYLEPVAVSGTDVSVRLRRTGDNGWVRYALGANSFAQFGANASTGEVQLFNSVSCFQTFYSNGAERMRIPTTGNVLIGTTTDAGFRLDVNGTARVNAQLEVNSVNSTQGILLKHFALATTATQIYYNSPDAVTYFDTLFNYNASSALGSYNFRTKNSSNALTSRLFIQGWDGSIGIGTTTPAATLDVNGTSRVSSNISGIYDGLQVRNSAGASNAQARIKFDNDITPTQTSTGGVVFYTSSVFSGFPSSSFGLWNYNSNGVIAFATNSTERLRIFSTGNIGINTTTDAGFRLDVNGTARVQGVLTASANNITGVLSITNASSAMSISMASLLAANATGDTYFTIGRSLTNDNAALIGHSTTGGGNYAFLTVYGRPANDLVVTATGQVALGTSTPNTSARFVIESTTQGFLPPRMTNAQRAAIASPAVGLIVYCTDSTEGLYVYKSTGWTFMV